MDELSEIAEILFGVPQGCCLGPLLFALMLYDLTFIETSLTILKYADDIVYAANGLKLKANKSKYMTFGLELNETLDRYKEVCGIEKVESIKYLGVNVDSKLAMNGHTKNLVNKISQSMNAMNIHKCHLPSYSILLYRLKAEDINRLQIIQNRHLR